MFVPIYIDDITNFKCRDIGPTVYLLGVGIGRDRSKHLITLHQSQSILDMLEHYKISNCHPVMTPMSPGPSKWVQRTLERWT